MTACWNHHLSTVVCVFVVGSTCCPVLAGKDDPDARKKSREQAAAAFVDLLGKKEFAAATRTFDATMLKVLPADKLKETWEQVTADAGAFKKRTGTRFETAGKYDVVLVTCEFTKKKMAARVVFDKDGKITGLFFRSPPPMGVEEIWEGALKVGAVEIRLVFHLFKQKDGSYVGTMDSPDQGARGIALDEVQFKDDALRLELKSARIVYEGKRAKDGKEISGQFKQAGQSFPLRLKRVAKLKEAKRPQTPRKPYPYDEIEVAYQNEKGGVKLAGTLTVPRGKGPFPAVLLITGSGAQDRDETLMGHKPFLVLADYLTRRGIAVLRVDDRGVGGSTGKVMESTSEDFADDVLAGVEFLKLRKEIDVAKIGLIGHSEGGIIAPLVAGRSRDVAFIVLLAGTGVPGEMVLYSQAAAMLKVAGFDREQLARQKEMQQRVFTVVRQEKDNAVAEKKIRDAIKDYTATLAKDNKNELVEALPLLKGQMQLVLTRWFRHFLDHDPQPVLRRVTCPVLALNGAKDLQVDAGLNLPAIEAALKAGGNKDFTIRVLPDLNHLFQTCKTGAVSEYSAIEETIAPAALAVIGDWISKRTAAAIKR